MKLLIDMNLSPGWAGFLQAAGFEATHWSHVGSANASDSEIMEFARQRGIVILTHDLDFGTILAASGGDSPSVVQIRSDDLRFDVIGNSVIAALRQLDELLGQGSLVTVDVKRTRIAVLPIGRGT